MKRVWLLENACVFSLPVLFCVYVYIVPTNWKVWRLKELNLTKSSFYKHFYNQIWTQIEVLLTKCLLSLAACSYSWRVAKRLYLWFPSQVWACFIKPGKNHCSSDYEQQKSSTTGYHSKPPDWMYSSKRNKTRWVLNLSTYENKNRGRVPLKLPFEQI